MPSSGSGCGKPAAVQTRISSRALRIFKIVQMNIDWIRQYCLSLPHTTETIQWGDDLVFKIGGKMYAVAALEPGDHWLSFKCSPDDFTRLVEQMGIIPAPYLARANWVAVETA